MSRLLVRADLGDQCLDAGLDLVADRADGLDVLARRVFEGPVQWMVRRGALAATVSFLRRRLEQRGDADAMR
jgi:hypothetical protein